MPSRKDTSDTMVTKKAPRKASEQLKKKFSVASSAAAAERDPAITVPSPPPKKGPNNNTAPSSSLRNLRYASRTQTVSSNPTSRSTEAIGEELPSEQVVTRLWSKGGIVKEIIAVQNESAKNRTIMGFGLRKSPPELNAAHVSTGGGVASAVTGPSINTGRNLDIVHYASSFPVPSITAQDNISVYSSSEDDSSMFDISAKKTTSNPLTSPYKNCVLEPH